MSMAFLIELVLLVVVVNAATPGRIREIRAASLNNFPAALRQFDRVRAYDNSRWGERPRLVIEPRAGKTHHVADEPPSWLLESLPTTLPPKGA